VVEIVGVERLVLVDTGRGQLDQQLFGDFIVGTRHQFAGVRIDHVV